MACVDPGADCESIANTLKLNAGTAFPVGPSKDYAAGLGKTLGGLDKKVAGRPRRAAGREDPEGAGRGGEGPLRRLQRAASAAVSKLEVSPADAAANAQLASALKETGDAYGKLAAAAASGNKSGYEKARAAVQRAEQAIAGALRGLEAAGYKIAE